MPAYFMKTYKCLAPKQSKLKRGIMFKTLFYYMWVWSWSFSKMRKDKLTRKKALNPSVLNIVINNTIVESIASRWKWKSAPPLAVEKQKEECSHNLFVRNYMKEKKFTISLCSKSRVVSVPRILNKSFTFIHIYISGCCKYWSSQSCSLSFCYPWKLYI